MVDAKAWLGRVHHDLVKRLLWPARDRRTLGGAVAPGELRVILMDADGAATTPQDLWAQLRLEAPPGAPAEALGRFERAVAAAVDAGAQDDVDGVLALDDAFAALARNVKEATGEPSPSNRK